MKTSTVVGAIVAVIVAGGAWYWVSQKQSAPVAQTQTAEYKNIAYTIEGQPVTLVNGRAETAPVPDSTGSSQAGSAAKTVTQYFGNEATGDLNGDGVLDVAFLLTQDTGGSGTFYYAVAAFKTADGYQGTNAVLLGDRIAPQSTEFRDGMIIVNYADRKSGESFVTPPSVGISKYFKIIDGELRESSSEPAAITCLPEQRNADFCTADYTPVCATVEIQCIKAPCNPIQQTFSNSCNACANPLVNAYKAGECK